MININEEKWSDIKNNLLNTVEYEFSEEPLIHFDQKHNTQEEIGTRETYEFTKNDMDFKLILDVENRLIKTSTEKDGVAKDHYSRSPNEFSYKLTIKYKDKDGSWKDSSAMEENL